MCEHNTILNSKQYLKIHAKQEQIKLIDMIMEGLCVKELTHEGRQFIKNLRENLKFEIEVLAKTLPDDTLGTSEIINSSLHQSIK